MIEQHSKVILAAYLHDMGKLLWRWGMQRKTNRYDIAHAQYVADFFAEEKYSLFWGEVGLLASLHHARDLQKFKKWELFSTPEEAKHLAWIVYMADNISSMERIDEEYLEPSREEYIKNAGLRTVFENIFAEKQLKNKRSYFPQTLQETSFEITDKGTNFEGAQFDAKIIGGVDDGRVRKGFQLLADQFTKKLEKIALEFPNPTPKDIKKLIYAIDSLTQNYFSFVPSDAYKSIGDISLYDHTKTTVAIASVLYLSGYHKESYKREQGQTPTQKVGRESICVIAGDFPSIQKYLFSSLKSQKHLAKRLRMRSMNVQLLNEAVIEYLLDRLGLSRANVLMNAWGKFVILAPYVAEHSLFESAKDRINDYFLQTYWTSLKVALIQQTVTIREIFDIQGEEIDTKWFFEQLFQKLGQEKFHVYTPSQLSLLFQNPNVAGKVLCKSCGLSYVSHQDVDPICTSCQEEVQGGRLLTERWGVAIQFKDNDNFCFDLIRDDQILKTEDQYVYLFFNDWEKQHSYLPTFVKSINTYIPRDDSWEAKSFEQLVDNQRWYLCMLKGDIDNMSIILKYGFEYATLSGEKKSIYSVSRLVQMSRMLELFFGKYLMTYLAREFSDIYTVFSGGDDFVFIIPFQKRLKFINTLYREFESFVAYNQNLHFSIGLQLFKDKTPIAFVDQQVEALLKQAKKASKYKLSKETLSKRGLGLYEERFSLLKSDANFDLEEEINLDWWSEVSDTLLYQRYLELSEMLSLDPSQQGAEYVKRGARLLYSITRNVQKKELKEKILEALKPIQDPSEKQKLRKILLQLTNLIYQKRV